MLSRPPFYWALATLFWARIVLLTALTRQRLDAEGMWEGAHAYLTNPSRMYEPAADFLATTHVIAAPGTLAAFVSPPPVAVLAIPFALLPKGVGVQVWTAFDAIGLVVALGLLAATLAIRQPLARAVFWLTPALFTPVFADVSAGQRGGVLLALAMASVWLERNRPPIAGALGGMAAALKYYPAAMIIGPRPAHRIRYAVVLFALVVVVTALSFIPIGFSGTLFYYEHVLVPSLGSHNTDCAYDSVRSLFTRTIGGEAFVLPTPNGYILVTSPLHLSALALALSYLSAVAFAAGAVWGAWRSGWNPMYGMSLGFALGALIPNEVWPYQWLPLLPLILLLVVRGVEARRGVTLALLAICLIGFLRPPCDLFFPNLWTLAAIGIFVLALWENRLFRIAQGESRDGAQR